MPAVHWVELASYADKLCTLMDMPDPLASSATATLRKCDLIRIIQILTANVGTEEEMSLTNRLLQQVVRLEDRIEELEHSATRTPFIHTPIVQAPAHIETPPVSPPPKRKGNDLEERVEEQAKRLAKVEETSASLALYCIPKSASTSKKTTVDVSFLPPYDQRVYKKEFVFGGLKWQIQLYPKGKTEEQKGYASVFFKLVSNHIQSPNSTYVRIEITSQVLNAPIQEHFSSGSTYGFAKAFEQRKLRGKIDFKLKFSFPTPVEKSTLTSSIEKGKRQLYL